MSRLTQEELDELRRTVPHATIEDIGGVWKNGADPEVVEDLTKYLHCFASPGKEEGQPCIRCSKKLRGTFTDQMLGLAGFEWGLIHGHGRCSHCGWPAVLYHFVKDRHGKELLTFRHVLLQFHPADIEIRT